MLDKEKEIVEEKATEHKMIMEDRQQLLLTGVIKVKSFDPKEIILETIKGRLQIKGQELGIKSLNLEESEVEIEGYIDVLLYPATRSTGSNKSIWEKLFK